ncbi:hypothetical protein TOPH_05323, partial [Tolypocladium ophioglossoides CBS 100239]
MPGFSAAKTFKEAPRPPHIMDSLENSPLLSTSASAVHSETQPSQFTRRKPSRALIIVLLLLLYHDKHDPSLIGSDGKDGVDEKWCKVDVLQGEVAMLKGLQIAFDGIGMLMFSVPRAYAADLHGRKPVILLLTLALFVKYTFVELICYFGGTVPLKWAWLSALHTLCGGSVTVATALIYTIISDVVPENERVAIFFQVMAATIATQFLGSLISAALMIWNPWIPMLLGLAHRNPLFYSRDPGLRRFSIANTFFIDLNGSSSAPAFAMAEFVVPRPKLDTLPCYDIRVLGIVSAFVVHMLFLNRDVMLQYISTRYKISLAQAAVLISIRSGLVFLLCVFILPIISIYCRNKFKSERSDLILSRISAALITLGFLGLGLAPNLPLSVSALVLNSLGWGLFSFLRSLLTSLVDTHKVARLNSVIGVFDTVGLMIGSPLLAALFTRGVELEGLWFGLPFLFCGGVVAIITLMSKESLDEVQEQVANTSAREVGL